jgi:hypothetical protein
MVKRTVLYRFVARPGSIIARSTQELGRLRASAVETFSESIERFFLFLGEGKEMRGG